MREITPTLTPELERQIGNQEVTKAEAISVDSYRKLIEQIAKLAYYNKDHLLFFRGQSQDHRKLGGASTFYPTIYRGDRIPKEDMTLRFNVLKNAGEQLISLFKENDIAGKDEVRKKRYIRWSILQHYEVCQTPLIDFSHSVQVACSFAQTDNNGEHAYVFVFGLPYLTNRISINSEHDIVNVRLLSICPPDALRPYFQEGYLAGTDEIEDEYDNKTELDFNRRLIAKFRIPNDPKFWGRGVSKLERDVLYPTDDEIQRLCSDIRLTVSESFKPEEIGLFLTEWVPLESLIISSATQIDRVPGTVLQALKLLEGAEKIDRESATDLHRLRRFRNRVVHHTDATSLENLNSYIDMARDYNRRLSNITKQG